MRRSRCAHEVSMTSCSVASPAMPPGRVYRMYWWMGSAMRPRPSYVSAAPFIGRSISLSDWVESMAVDRPDADGAHLLCPPHGDLDRVARRAPPHLLVE